jgi:hypothetical protein
MAIFSPASVAKVRACAINKQVDFIVKQADALPMKI